MTTVTLGKTGITVNKNGFGALPIQRITKEEAAKRGKMPTDSDMPPAKPAAPKPKVLHRSRVCPTKTLRSEEEVLAYVDSVKDALMDALHESGAVRLGD